MATSDFTLATAPSDTRELQLWLQHAAGFILFQDMREYALSQIDPDLSAAANIAARKAIDDSVYGLMMILDGVTGGLANQRNRVNLRVAVELLDCDSQQTVSAIDLADGDGMCMGYHGWREGDFGETPLVSPE